LRILFFHGLEGNPNGAKATFLKHHYNAYVPALDTTELRALKKNENDSWSSVVKGEILKAARLPLSQAREAILEFKPDIIIGSSMGGAILARMIVEGNWSGPCIFLASAAKLLFGINKVTVAPGMPLMWVHGYYDDVIPLTNSLNAAQDSYGKCRLVQDDHRLESLAKDPQLFIGIIEEVISEMA